MAGNQGEFGGYSLMRLQIKLEVLGLLYSKDLA